MLEGTILNQKYRLECELGRGSFAAVYRAWQINIDRPVAIKFLLPNVRADETLRGRLKREAKLCSQLHSPHTVGIHDCGTTPDGNLYIVMELLTGTPLDIVLRDHGPMPPARVRVIVRQILDSLSEAHRLGILHRDLKPANIFLQPNEVEKDFVKIIDFGIAKIVRHNQSRLRESRRLTRTGEIIGTMEYMSPEQCRNRELTPASDLYSVGIILYELLTGKVPFSDVNALRVMMQHDSAEVPALPPALADTTVGRAAMRALQKPLEKRFASAEQMIAFLDEKPGPLPEPAPWNPAQSGILLVAPNPLWSWPKVALVTAGAMLLLTVGWLVGYLWR